MHARGEHLPHLVLRQAHEPPEEQRADPYQIQPQSTEKKRKPKRTLPIAWPSIRYLPKKGARSGPSRTTTTQNAVNAQL